MTLAPERKPRRNFKSQCNVYLCSFTFNCALYVSHNYYDRQCDPHHDSCSVNYEPRCEKTGIRGFRPGPTRTRLYNHTRWPEAYNFGFVKWRDCTIHVAKTKALIISAVTAQLICVLVFACAKIWFSHDAAPIWLGIYDLITYTT